MGLIHVVQNIAADMLAAATTAKVFFGPEFLAQDDAAFRAVVVPTDDDYSYDRLPSGQNPRPIRSRRCGAIAQLWAKGATQPDPLDQPAADWIALDALINQFILSLHRATPGNYEMGKGRMNTKTPHVQYGRQYDLQFFVFVPIVDTPWIVATDIVPIIHGFFVFPSGDVPITP